MLRAFERPVALLTGTDRTVPLRDGDAVHPGAQTQRSAIQPPCPHIQICEGRSHRSRHHVVGTSTPRGDARYVMQPSQMTWNAERRESRKRSSRFSGTFLMSMRVKDKKELRPPILAKVLKPTLVASYRQKLSGLRDG